VGLQPFACWDCGFESSWGHECLSLVSVACCQVMSLRRADHSSRGVLPSMVCLSVIVKSRKWGGPSPLGAVATLGDNNSYYYLFTAIGFSPGGSSPYTSAHYTNGHINIHKNNNTKQTTQLQNKIHTVNTSTHIRTPYTHYKNIHTLQKHPLLTKASTPYKNIHTLQIHPHLTKTPIHIQNKIHTVNTITHIRKPYTP
jgi:hypothetical protein